MWAILKIVGFSLTMYLNGIAIGMGVSWLISGQSTRTDDSAHVENQAFLSKFTTENAGVQVNWIQRGEQSMRHGQISQAKLFLQKAVRDQPNDFEAIIKLGLANQLANDWSKSSQLYQRASELSVSPKLQRLAMFLLAQSDDALGKRAQSRGLLWHLAMDQGQNDPSVALCTHLLAIQYANSLLPDQALVADMFSPTRTESSHHLVGTLALINGMLQHSKQNGAGVENPQEVNPVRNLRNEFDIQALNVTPDVSNRLFRVRSSSASSKDVLVQVANLCEIKVSVSRLAKASLESNGRKISVERISFPLLMHWLTAPLQLSWRQTESSLEIISLEEMPETERDVFLREQAALFLQNSLFRHSEIYLAGESRLAYANLLMSGSRFLDCVGIYREIVQDIATTRSIRHAASINLGKCYYQLDQAIQAKRALYWTADDLAVGDASAIALILVSKIAVNEQDFSTSVRVSSRAVGAALDKDLKSEAALRLAMGYLLEGKYYSANQALAANRQSIKEESYDFASFLNSLARYEANKDAGQDPSPGELIRALGNTRDEMLNRFPEAKLLVSRAYREFGFVNRAIETLLELVVSDVDRGLRNYALEQAGQLYSANPQIELNSKLFGQFQGSSISAEQLELSRRLKTKFLEGDLKTCKSICFQLLQQDSSPQMTRKALHYLGQIMEREGKHHSAALCFAGLPLYSEEISK